MYETIKTYLQNEKRARERKWKNRAIGNLMIKQYQLEIDKERMSEMVGEILNADRMWRLVLKENEELRGTDYDEKTELEINKQRELGYHA